MGDCFQATEYSFKCSSSADPKLYRSSMRYVCVCAHVLALRECLAKNMAMDLHYEATRLYADYQKSL
jgi:hypothetical protein